MTDADKAFETAHHLGVWAALYVGVFQLNGPPGAIVTACAISGFATLGAIIRRQNRLEREARS